MISTITSAVSTLLGATLGAAAVASLILLLIVRELSSAHSEETGNSKSRSLASTLLVPLAPLLVVFAFIVAAKIFEVL